MTRTILPYGGIKEYPTGFTLPVNLEFKRIRSTINTGYLEEACLVIDVDESSPVQIYAMATDDNRLFFESNIILKVWGTLILTFLTHVMIYRCPEYRKIPYAASVEKAEFYA
jgi:hypothetical protein